MSLCHLTYCSWLAGSVTPGLASVLGGHPLSSGGGAETGVRVAGLAAGWGQSDGAQRGNHSPQG